MKGQSLRQWLAFLAAALVTAAASAANATVIEKVLNTRGAAGFDESTLGTSTSFADTIDRGVCPQGEVLTQVKIDISDVDIATRLQFTNPLNDPDTVDNTFTEHTALKLVLQASADYAVGEAPIVPPNRYPPPAGGTNVFTCLVPAGADQSACSPTPLPVPMLETSRADGQWILTQADGAAFDYFKTPGTIPVVFTAGGRVQTNVPASWQTENQTPATGNIKITYTCEVAPDPLLVCDSKTLNPAVLNGPDGFVNAAFSISNPGNVDFNANVDITDTMDAKMELNLGTVVPIGDPVGGPPGSYTWSGLSLAQAARLTSPTRRPLPGSPRARPSATPSWLLQPARPATNARPASRARANRRRCRRSGRWALSCSVEHCPVLGCCSASAVADELITGRDEVTRASPLAAPEFFLVNPLLPHLRMIGARDVRFSPTRP